MSAIGLYVHIPFCTIQCPYCNFYKKPYNLKLETQFLKAVATDAASYASEPISTIYLGGGTPSALSPSGLTQLIESLTQQFDLTAVTEFTIEANPSDITNTFITTLTQTPITRISLGVQSSKTTLLTHLGRDHTHTQTQTAIQSLKAAGYANITVDLIYDTPNQTPDQLIDILTDYLNLDVPHISTYSLTIEPGTPFFDTHTPMASDQSATHFQLIDETFTAASYRHYETSAFAKPGFESQHNLGYWTMSSYIGLGPSAHSFYNGHRYRNVPSFDSYCANPVPIIPTGKVDLAARAVDYIMIALRLDTGINFSIYSNWATTPFLTRYETPLARLHDAGLVEWSDTHCWATKRGHLVLDSLIQELL